jgi:hypothetical protein
MKLVMQSILHFLFLLVDYLNFNLVSQNKILLARVSVGLSVTTEHVQWSEAEVNCSDLLSEGSLQRISADDSVERDTPSPCTSPRHGVTRSYTFNTKTHKKKPPIATFSAPSFQPLCLLELIVPVFIQ